MVGVLARCAVALGLVVASVQAASDNYTAIHEKGRCAIRGQCGSRSIFEGELPCLDNGKAEEPSKSLRKRLVDICGDMWAEGPVCCLDDQVCFLCYIMLSVH